MKFWNWGPTTIWYNIESVAFLFSKSLHPTLQHSRQAAQHGWWDHRESTLEGSSAVHSCLCGLVLTGVYLIKFSNRESLIQPLQQTQPYSPSARCNVHNVRQGGSILHFFKFYAKACCLRFPQVQYGNLPNFFYFSSKTSERFKGPYFQQKNQETKFFKSLIFLCIL